MLFRVILIKVLRFKTQLQNILGLLVQVLNFQVQIQVQVHRKWDSSLFQTDSNSATLLKIWHSKNVYNVVKN